MEDHQIVCLYWERSERAIAETERKYGQRLLALSYALLSSHQDAEECVNDTYLAAWNSIPPQRPQYLGAFLSKLTRGISIDRFRRKHSEKRGGLQNLTLELCESIPDTAKTPAEAVEEARLGEAINRFLSTLPRERRAMFVQRYFYAASIPRIAEQFRMREGSVAVTLHRIREKLKLFLQKEDLL